ncbi:MAG: hypothetical protein WC982_13175 [Advenella sp.]
MKAMLTKTVQRGGEFYRPETVVNWPAAVVKALIDDDAAEPVADIRPVARAAGADADPDEGNLS